MHRAPTSRALALLALLAACTPGDPASTTDESGTSTSTSTSTASESVSSTSGQASTTADPTAGTTAAESTSTTAAPTSTTTSDTTGADTLGGRGCGDGVAEPGELCFDALPFDDLYISDLVFADLDEDGHLDLVGIAALPCPLVDDGITLAAAAPAGAPRDGAIFYSRYTALGDGTGALTFIAEDVPTDGAGVDPTVVDFTGDGRLDLALGAYVDMNGAIALSPGDGAGGFAAPVVSPLPIRVNDLEAGDLDGDGDLDLLVAGYDGVVVARGDGGGAFTADPPVDATPHQRPLLHDLDDDGDLDLIIAKDSPHPALETHFNDGFGAFKPGDPIALDGAILDVERLAPAKGDDPVVLVATYKSMVGYRLFAFDVQGGALGAPTEVPDAGGDALVVGRFDGGPRPDVFAFYPALRAVLGEEPWPPPALLLDAEAPSLAGHPGVGDLDEDGVDDILYYGDGLTLLLSNP